MRSKLLTRRAALTGAVALGALAATAPGADAKSAGDIEASVARAERELYATVPGARELAERALGILIIPDVVKGGLIVGGEYGEGALRVGGATEAYYSVAAGSIGYQIGVQKSNQVLFFLSQGALDMFRNAEGFEIGADAEVTLLDAGLAASIDSTTARSPVIAIVFGQDGFLAGASIEGAKYSRINR